MSVSNCDISTQQSDYVSKLCDIGGKVYIVGGANRNYLFNCIHKTDKLSKDFDYLICGLQQEEIINVLTEFGKVKEVGQAFGIILFTPNDTKENIEFALPRTEISTGPGYRDFIITPDPFLPIEDDFSRRDSPINAIGFQIYSIADIDLLDHNKNPEPEFSRFIDPFGGISDISNKIWRSIGDPYKRFLEDPTRIMRAFRQSGELDLEIEANTLKGIGEHYDVMKALIPDSYVRLYNELLKLVKVKTSGKFLMIMSELGILKFLGIDNKINTDLIETLNKSNFIIKLALMIQPDHMDIPIKKWIHDRQILATTNFKQSDLHILIAIQTFTTEIKDMIETECCVEMLIFRLLKIREQIYKYAKFDSTDVIEQVLQYVKITHGIGINIKFMLADFDKYIMSTDQLVLSGDIIQERWGLKGKQIGQIKGMILDEIFNGKLLNEKEQLISYVNKTYLSLN